MTIRTQGRIRITYDLLREALGLPEDVAITDLGIDMTRQIIDVMYVPKTDKHIPGAHFFMAAEGQEIPVGDVYDTTELNPVHYAIYERVRNLLVGTVPNESDCACGDDGTCLYHLGGSPEDEDGTRG